MAEATLLQQKKRQQVLLGVLGLLAVATGLVLWFGFFRQPPASSPGISPGQPASFQQNLQVNFSVFEHPIFQELQEPLAEPSLPENIGRRNPFIPLEGE